MCCKSPQHRNAKAIRMGWSCRAASGLQYFVLTGLLYGSLSSQFPALAQSKPSEPTAFSIPRIQRTELLNGLRVIAIEKPGETAVINVMVKSGSQADPKDKAGLANLTAQSICFANAKLPPQRWKDELEFLNARIDIHVTSDSTVFQAQAPPSNVEAVLALFAR